MPPDSFEQTVNAIADGTPVAWPSLELTHGAGRSEVDSLHLLHDVASAFRAADRSPSSARTPLFQWGSLEVEQRIGAGTFGEVWRAFDPWLGRTVALKLQRAKSGESSRRAEPLDEARLLARLRHPNVLSCYGCAIHDGRAGLWSELIEGRSLAEVLVEDGALSIDEALRIGRDLARALAAVHDAGLVHGDVKAANVMRESGGRVVLMDFGGGGEERLLASQRVLSATPAYLPPEVLDGEPLSRGSDLYALGVLVFLLLTGRTPYAADDVTRLRSAMREGRRLRLATLRPDLDPATAAAIERCIDVEPAKRPNDTADLATLLSLPAAREEFVTEQRSALPVLIATAALIAMIAIALGLPWLLPPPWSANAQFVRTHRAAMEPLTADAVVAPGDHLRLRVSSNRATFVYVLNEDAAGTASVLYPLVGKTAATSSGDATTLPGAGTDESLSWEVGDDADREEFLVIAALAPIASLERAIAAWPRSSPAPDSVTRSLGVVVRDRTEPQIEGERLRAILAALKTDDKGVRVWRYAFPHAPKG